MTRNQNITNSMLIASLIPLLITMVVGVADRPHLIDRCWPMWLGWVLGAVLFVPIARFITRDE